MAQWLHLRPSDLLEMREAGYPSPLRFSFDEAVIDFMEWVATKQGEQKKGIVRRDDRLKENETWVPTYDSVDDILDLYDAASAIRTLQAELATVDLDDVRALVTEVSAESDVLF